ncbi:hypothetical protein TIFTF001_055733 [Ficus carica]|uniref:Uncharacterized protein n=1 Tax=Ficus carica TaxID=3494 RepID=A0AA88EF94_FICCA|nr:hypothetical protein TIFTF001_055733 [Ficus carica]
MGDPGVPEVVASLEGALDGEVDDAANAALEDSDMLEAVMSTE